MTYRESSTPRIKTYGRKQRVCRHGSELKQQEISMKRQAYLTNDQIYDEWIIYKNTGVVTDQLGIYMKSIATHMLGSASFRGYP